MGLSAGVVIVDAKQEVIPDGIKNGGLLLDRRWIGYEVERMQFLKKLARNLS